MKSKFKRVMINNSPNIIKTNIYLLSTSLNMTYDVGNPGPGLGQTQKCGEVKPVNGISILSLLIIGSPNAIKI